MATTPEEIKKIDELVAQPITQPIPSSELGFSSSGAARELVGTQQQKLQQFGANLESARQQVLKIQEGMNKLAEKEKVDKAAAEQQKQQAAMEAAAVGLPPKAEKTEEQKVLEQQITDNETRAKQIDAEFQEYSAYLDTALQSQLDGIRNIYAGQIREMNDINNRILQAREQAGIRGGAARFAPEIDAGIILGEQKAGADRVGKIIAAQNEAIAQAISAREESRHKDMAEKTKQINELEKTKITALIEIAKLADKRNEEIKKKKDELIKQESFAKNQQSILDIISSGITDTLDISRAFDNTIPLQDIVDVRKMLNLTDEEGISPGLVDSIIKNPSLFSILTPTTKEKFLSFIGEKAIEFAPPEDVEKQLDIALKQQQLIEQRLANEAKQTDISTGTLTDKDVDTIEKSTQGKNLVKLGDLRAKSERYKSLIEQFGIGVVGTQKTLLNNTFAELKIAWKEAANLGALTGPDLDLIIEAVAPSTGAAGIKQKFLGGGVTGLLTAIQQMVDNIDKDAKRSYDLLLSRNTKYQGSEFVNQLALPFEFETGNYIDALLDSF